MKKEGLLPQASRSQGNFRLYGEMHAERLQFIRHCRSLDMTLMKYASYCSSADAPEDNCSEVNALLDKHIEHVAHRIRELKGLESQLKSLRKLCTSAQATKDCGILQNLGTAEEHPVRNLGSHGSGCH